MFIVYAPNNFIVANQDALRLTHDEFAPVVFRNAAAYLGEVESCEGVAVYGNFPSIVNAYDNAEIKVTTHDLTVQQEKEAPKEKPKTKPAQKVRPVPEGLPGAGSA